MNRDHRHPYRDAKDFISFAEYGRQRRTWLSQFLDLRIGNHAFKVGMKNKRLAAGWEDEYLA